MVETVPNKRRKNSNFVRKLRDTVLFSPSIVGMHDPKNGEHQNICVLGFVILLF